MKKVILICYYLACTTLISFAQEASIQGTVVELSGEGLPGVTIVIKSSGLGAVTDLDGNYKINVAGAQQETLIFSFIGYETQAIQIGSRSEVNVVLEEQDFQLNEVIVTAMNISQDKHALNFAAQDIKAKDITESQQQNLVNSLQGKVAGVMVTSSSGSPGSSSSIVLRGGTSISEGRSNEPLFVIDGIIMNNSSFEGSGNAAMDLNPDDIESMTVLKGPSAAALYGIGAGNGAVIITTKSGKDGKIQVNFGSTVAIDVKNKTHEVQTTYGRGLRGIADDESSFMWGPAYTQNDEVYDNIGEFFQTGVQQKYDLSISGGNSKSNYYMSVSNNNQTGIVPGEKYNRFNYLLKGSIKLRDNLNVTASINNTLSTNKRGGAGSMFGVYRWPTDDEMSNYLNPNGSKKWLLDSIDPIYNNPENPYWSINNNLPEYETTRSMSQIFFDWDVFEPFKITYRIGLDQSDQYYRNPTVPESSGSSANYQGKIYESELSRKQVTSALNASFSKTFNEDWDVYVLAGFMADISESRAIRYSGTGFLLPDLMTINNVITPNLPSQSTGQRRVLGAYGEMKLEYKGIISIGATGRNDWTSTIDPSRNSFFYPSVTAGLVFTELFGNRLSPVLSFGKLRANWAQSGQDAPIESLGVILEQYQGIGGGYKHEYQAGNESLKPEFLNSYEFGVNLAFLDGMINLDVTHYNTKSVDMIIKNRISTASGWVIQTFNSGDMENEGWEVVLDTKIKRTGKLKWDMTWNFSKNSSKLSELPGFISRLPVTAGQIINEAKPIAYKDRPLYAIEGIPYLRNENGNVVIDEDGYPRWGTYALDENGEYELESDGSRKVSQENVYLGNREPDWMMGITNTISYQKFDLSFLFDIRKGGDIINVTASALMSSGLHKALDDGRNINFLFDGEVETPDGFVTNDTEATLDHNYYRFGYRSVGENFVEDGSWLKLRYVALSYDLTDVGKKIGMQNLKATVTGRNLFMLTTYSGGDPENDYSGSAVGGAGTLGLDYFNVPTTKGITFSLKATF